MAKKKTFGQVEYEDVGDAYFEKRGLRRYARVWSLWALGVGAVISGDFFGRPSRMSNFRVSKSKAYLTDAHTDADRFPISGVS